MDCTKCKWYEVGTSWRDCTYKCKEKYERLALDLISQMQEEIRQLKAENEYLRKRLES